MDNSPLIKAHDHARAAAVATRQASDTTVAVNEHTQAAGEFANAAKTTSSIEALRTLRLLEAHHRKLAEILNLSPELSLHTEYDETDEKTATEKDNASQASLNKDVATDGRTNKTLHMPGLAKQPTSTSREMSSSIASKLAVARGIRSRYGVHPLSPSVSNDQAPGNVDPHARKDASKSKMQSIIEHQSGKPTWVPPAPPSSARAADKDKPAGPTCIDAIPSEGGDGGYAKFYNTFGSLINKISAPLAFAGLPLIQEESTISEADDPSLKRITKNVTSSVLEPDLSKIYSKATMRALAREGHSTHESFYVVPTSGHTMSYANILSYAEKEKRRLVTSANSLTVDNSMVEEVEDFVDAKETPSHSTLSPGAKRRIGRVRTEKELNNTIEELYTENQSLKDMLDKLSKRLQAFETSAQSSAMALAESYRFMRPTSPNSSANKPGGDDGMRQKSFELEQQLASATRHVERLEKDNRKMQKTLEKYREKWEVLKAGAKARRDGQKAGEGIDGEI